MTSLYAVVVVLTAAVISSTVAVTTCDQDIVDLLKKKSDCYKDGKPPALKSSGGMGTHEKISAGVLPVNTHCVTAIGRPGFADVTLYGKDYKKILGYTVQQTPQDGYLLETDEKGGKYRLYVIHNEANVYSYYRCIHADAEGNGEHMGDVAVGCKNVGNKESKDVIDKAMKCFAQIGIKNIIDLTPCPSTLCK